MKKIYWLVFLILILFLSFDRKNGLSFAQPDSQYSTKAAFYDLQQDGKVNAFDFGETIRYILYPQASKPLGLPAINISYLSSAIRRFSVTSAYGFTRQCIACRYINDQCPSCDYLENSSPVPPVSASMGYAIDSVLTSDGNLYYAMLGNASTGQFWQWNDYGSGALTYTYNNIIVGENIGNGASYNIYTNSANLRQSRRVDTAIMVTETGGSKNLYAIQPHYGTDTSNKAVLRLFNFGSGSDNPPSIEADTPEILQSKDSIEAVYEPSLDFGAFVFSSGGYTQNSYWTPDQKIKAFVYDQGEWYGTQDTDINNNNNGLVVFDLVNDLFYTDYLPISDVVISASIVKVVKAGETVPRLIVALSKTNGYGYTTTDSYDNIYLFAADWNYSNHNFELVFGSDDPDPLIGTIWQPQATLQWALGRMTAVPYTPTPVTDAEPKEAAISAWRYDPYLGYLIELFTSSGLSSVTVDFHSLSWQRVGESVSAGVSDENYEGCVKDLSFDKAMVNRTSGQVDWDYWLLWAFSGKNCNYDGDRLAVDKPLYKVYVSRFDSSGDAWLTTVNNEPLLYQHSDWDCSALGCKSWKKNKFWLSLTSLDAFKAQAFVTQRFHRTTFGGGGSSENRLNFSSLSLYYQDPDANNDRCIVVIPEGQTSPAACSEVVSPSPSYSPSPSSSASVSPSPSSSPSQSPSYSPSPSSSPSQSPSPRDNEQILNNAKNVSCNELCSTLLSPDWFCSGISIYFLPTPGYENSYYYYDASAGCTVGYASINPCNKVMVPDGHSCTAGYWSPTATQWTYCLCNKY